MDKPARSSGNAKAKAERPKEDRRMARSRKALSDAFVYIDEIIDGVKAKSASILVFLDACRNNPFAREDAQGLSASTGRM